MEEIKIKLIAIAKNEAANLPQWVFHHFRIGVDSIDVYINGCLLYTSPSPRDPKTSRMPSSA